MKYIFLNGLASILIFTSAQTGLAAPTVYIPLGSANQVIEVDAEVDKITAQYSGVENPHGLVATPDGEYLIAGSLKEVPLEQGQSKDSLNSKLYLIHPAHGHVMSTIGVAGWTHHQAITPNGRYVISTHGARGTISVVDLNANELFKTIETGPSPNYTVITRDGNRAYVSNTGNNTVSEIDLSSWTVVRTLDSGPGPEHLVFSEDESLIYATNPRVGHVSAIDVNAGKVVKTFEIGKGTHGLDISDDGRTLYVSSKKGDKLVALNTMSGDMRDITLTPAPYHLNTIRGTGKVYVSSRKKPIIWVVDQKTLDVLGTIDLPAGEAHQMVIVD